MDSFESDSRHEFPVAAVPKKREPFWGYDDLAVFLGLAAASIFVTALALRLILLAMPRLREDPILAALPAQIVLYVLLLFSLALLFRIRYGQALWPSLGWITPRLPLWMTALAGVLLPFVLTGIGFLLRAPKIDSPFEKFTKSDVWLVIFGLFAVILGPAFEELIFRGFLQPLFSKTLGLIGGIIVTAFIFGALHGPEYQWAWQYVLIVTLAGVAFGWMRVRSGSTIASTVMHAAYNAVFYSVVVSQRFGIS